MAGYKVKVVIPYKYITVYFNMISEADLEQYKECLAFALSDRWNLEDLEFEVSREAEEHSFACIPEAKPDVLDSPNKIEFSIALEEAINRYQFLKTGHPTKEFTKSYYAGTTFSNPFNGFTPLMTNRLEESKPDDAEES